MWKLKVPNNRLKNVHRRLGELGPSCLRHWIQTDYDSTYRIWSKTKDDVGATRRDGEQQPSILTTKAALFTRIHNVSCSVLR